MIMPREKEKSSHTRMNCNLNPLKYMYVMCVMYIDFFFNGGKSLHQLRMYTHKYYRKYDKIYVFNVVKNEKKDKKIEAKKTLSRKSMLIMIRLVI